MTRGKIKGSKLFLLNYIVMHAPCVKSPDTYPSGCGLAVLLLDVTSVQSFTLPTQPWTEVRVQQIDPAKALVQAQQTNQTFSWADQGVLSNTDTTRDCSNPSTYSPNAYRSCGKDRARVSGSFLITNKKAERASQLHHHRLRPEPDIQYMRS